MNNFELVYGDIDLKIDRNKPYVKSRDTIASQVFKKNTCKLLWEALTINFDAVYAEKIITLIKENKIVITDEKTFPYQNNNLYNGTLDSFYITTIGYLKPVKQDTNNISCFIADVESCIMDLQKDGVENIHLKDICFVLASHLNRYRTIDIVNNIILKNKVLNSMDTFKSLVKNLILTLSTKDGGVQNTTIHLYDRTFFERVNKNYTLPGGNKEFECTYDLYKEVQELIITQINNIHFHKGIITPNIKAYFYLDEEHEIIDKELHQSLLNIRPKNIEIINYSNDSYFNLSVLSETIIDFKYFGTLDKTKFEQRLAEHYIDAQTINQMKRMFISSNKFDDYCLCTKIINVPYEMYEITKQVLDGETKYLKSSYTDNFCYEISVV